jgi:hypothetical protein
MRLSARPQFTEATYELDGVSLSPVSDKKLSRINARKTFSDAYDEVYDPSSDLVAVRRIELNAAAF